MHPHCREAVLPTLGGTPAPRSSSALLPGRRTACLFRGNPQRIEHFKPEFIPSSRVPHFRDFFGLPCWVARYEFWSYGVGDLLIKQVRDLYKFLTSEIHARDLLGQLHFGDRWRWNGYQAEKQDSWWENDWPYLVPCSVFCEKSSKREH